MSKVSSWKKVASMTNYTTDTVEDMEEKTNTLDNC